MELYFEKDCILDDRYRLIRPLNLDVATADVCLAEDTLTKSDDDYEADGDKDGMVVALKIYRPKNALDIEGVKRFKDEFKVVFNCHHTNLLQPTGFSVSNGTPIWYCHLVH